MRRRFALAHALARQRREARRVSQARYERKRLRRADLVRRWLVRAMGGACCVCGARRRLEFDHPWGRDWDPALLHRYYRMVRYFVEWRGGNLRLLCSPCNGLDGAYRRDHWNLPLFGEEYVNEAREVGSTPVRVPRVLRPRDGVRLAPAL